MGVLSLIMRTHKTGARPCVEFLSCHSCECDKAVRTYRYYYYVVVATYLQQMSKVTVLTGIVFIALSALFMLSNLTAGPAAGSLATQRSSFFPPQKYFDVFNEKSIPEDGLGSNRRDHPAAEKRGWLARWTRWSRLQGVAVPPDQLVPPDLVGSSSVRARPPI